MTMPYERSVTISNGSTTSDVLALPPGQYLQSIEIPTTIQGTYFNIQQASNYNSDYPNNSTWRDLWSSGTASVVAEKFQINYTANTFVRLSPQDLFACTYLRFVSNSAQSQDTILKCQLSTF